MGVVSAAWEINHAQKHLAYKFIYDAFALLFIIKKLKIRIKFTDLIKTNIKSGNSNSHALCGNVFNKCSEHFTI